jgi:hypothetical protein
MAFASGGLNESCSAGKAMRSRVASALGDRRISPPFCLSTPRFRNIICNQRFAMISCLPLIRRIGDSMGPVTST